MQRFILRKRRGLEGRGRGIDHQRWPNRYFTKLGLFCLLDVRESTYASLRNGANHCLESRMREIRPPGSEGGAVRKPRSYLYPCGPFYCGPGGAGHAGRYPSTRSSVSMQRWF